ncbi:MAG: lysophospholipid acyltransferase family protein [Methylovulum sp.]|uniref:lysophospholipid acyltransferase family protein n=1 Tax=Methylovulum sp. TaxID=1916980 RepID=UPI00263487AF|nr:lysophospholipid acyltransferase family protein [Methylovulum sp.]MDD2724450.1 lysophospholipid acyltransferase family protein [Methylovulum sp.]MDD5123671.1 lysophospholipid acyltransferase family protein [Methylovulum sp.]
MKSKSRLFYKLLLVILLFVAGFIIAAIVFPTLNLLCSANAARNHRDALKKQWICWFSSILKLEITREGNVPLHSSLVVSNHISWVDIIVIGQYLPAYFVAKSDILAWPLLGFLSRQAGAIFIRRGDKKHIMETAEKMVWLLKQNRNLIAFPEGTTTVGNHVLNFHASLFQPALLTKTAIQPVAIEYLGDAQHLAPFIGDDAFVPHLIKMLGLEKIEVRLSFLPTVNASGKNRHAVSHEARDLILGQISNDALYKQHHSA